MGDIDIFYDNLCKKEWIKIQNLDKKIISKLLNVVKEKISIQEYFYHLQNLKNQNIIDYQYDFNDIFRLWKDADSRLNK